MNRDGISVAQAAKLLGCSEQYVRRRCGFYKHHAQYLEHERVGDRNPPAIRITDRELVRQYREKFGEVEAR